MNSDDELNSENVEPDIIQKDLNKVRLVLGIIAEALWLPILAYVTLGRLGEGYFVILAMFTVPLTLFVAVPFYLLTKKYFTFLVSIYFGLAIGALVALVYYLNTDPINGVNMAPIFLLLGLISSVLFWIVAIWKNGSPTSKVRL